MIEKSEKKNIDVKTIAFVLGWLLLFGWRVYVLIRFAFCYIDDDQALMWYGTAHLAHGHFPEPCFFGQNYGSMWESLLAVPLYLVGWPLHVALPTTTMLWGIFPFVVLSVLAFRKKRMYAAWGLLLLVGACGWAWDVLTSIPRALIPGLPLTVLAVSFLQEETAGFRKKCFAVFLGMIGFVMTETALIILGLGIFQMILREKKGMLQKKCWLPILIGGAAGGCIYGLRCLFYVLHPEYALYHATKGGFSLMVFMRNMSVLPHRLSEYCFAGKVGCLLIPLFLVIVLILCFKSGNRETAYLLLASIVAAILMLGLERAYGYDDDSLLYGQLRILLFWAYLAAVILNSFRKKGEHRQDLYGVAILLLCVMLICKGVLFERTLADPTGMAWNTSFISWMRTDDLQDQAEMLMEAHRQSGADVAVCTSYARVMAYGASALYYDEPITFYIPDRDRRYWIWQEMSENKPHRILFYSLPVGGEGGFSLLDLDETMSPVQYFEREYGLSRESELEWGIPWEAQP